MQEFTFKQLDKTKIKPENLLKNMKLYRRIKLIIVTLLYFSRYSRIRMYAWYVSSIGEAIRFISAYYFSVYKDKPEDEYYILVPFSDNDYI